MGKRLLPAVLVGLGLGFVVLSVILGFVVVPNIIEGKIEEEVSLKNGTETWDKWIENPVPIYLDFMIFNVTNPDEVINGAKPILQEVGPYSFEEVRVKHVSNVNETEDTITYRQTIHYYFNEARSEGRLLTDKVNIVNLPLMAVATNLYGTLGPLGHGIVKGLIDLGETIISKDVTVGQLTFDGFPILKQYGQILALTGEIPPEFVGDTFGFYKGKHGMDDGEYKIHGGNKNSANFGKIITWNNKTSIDWWASPKNMTNPVTDKHCNAINGTDGGVFPPFLEKDSIIRIFVTDICRSIHFEFKEEEEHQGINGYKFGFPSAFYDDPKDNGDNYCFCPSPPGNLDGTCTKGVIRIFPCQNGAPIVTSSPHFIHGDQEFVGKVEGLSPTEGKHDTYAVLEPNTGLMLKISKKVQINIEMQNFQGALHEMFDDIDHYLFPVFWADEIVELDQTNADDLKGKLLTPLKIVNITKWVVIGVGALLAAGGIAIYVKRIT